MNKATTKDGLPVQKHRYNMQVISAIASKRNVTEDFVRKCVRGDRKSMTAEEIRAEYDDLAFKMANMLFSNQQP